MTRRNDDEMPAEFVGLFRPGHYQLPKQNLIQPAPAKPGGKRPKPEKAPSPQAPPPYKQSPAKPKRGAQVVRRSRKTQQGK